MVEGIAPERLREMKLKTVILYALYVVLGVVVAVPGPTLVNMRALFSTDTATLSLALSFHGVGYMAGAALCGWVFHRLSSELQFSLGTLVAGAAFIACPWSGNVTALIVLMTVFGIGIGYVDTGGNSQIISMWAGHRSKDPLLQCLHFAWSVGTTISPFLVTPFLSDLPSLGNNITINSTTNSSSLVSPFISQMTELGTNDSISNSTRNASALVAPFLSQLAELGTNDSISNSANSISSSTSNTSFGGSVPTVDASDAGSQDAGFLDGDSDALADVSRVRFAYLWTGLLVLVMAGSYFAMFLLWRAKPQATRSDSKKKQDAIATREIHSESRAARYGLLAQLFLFAFTFGIALNVAGGYYALFVVEDLSWSVSDGAMITSTFMGALGIGRLLGIPVSYFVSAKHLLFLNLLMSFSGHVALNFSQGFEPLALFAVVSFTGLGLSTMGVNILLWVSGHLRVTNGVSASYFTGNSMGFIIGYALVGKLMQSLGYHWFAYCVLTTSIIQVLLVVSMMVYIKLVLPHRPVMVVETDVKEKEMEGMLGVETEKEKESMLGSMNNV